MAAIGSYVVGFTVHEARGLRGSDGQSVDPLIVVRAAGRKYETAVKHGKSKRAIWEESHIWNDLKLTEDEFNMSYIDFELQSAWSFGRNEVLGTAKVQLAMVRKRPNHSYVQRVLDATNGAQQTAKIKVTVFCYGNGDEPPKPEDMEQDGEEMAAQLENLNLAVLGDQKAKGDRFSQGYHLFVHVHRAEHLGGGEEKFNPYIVVEFNNNTLELPPMKETHTFSSDECFRLPVTTPLFADSIVVRVMDKRRWQDATIVQGRLSFSLLRMHALLPSWFNFYGFSSKEVKDVASLMQRSETIEENSYQGRLLISARVQKVPTLDDLHKAALVKAQLLEEPPGNNVSFICDVYEVSGCPGSEVYVQISLGIIRKKSKTVPRCSDANEDANACGMFRFEGEAGRIPSFFDTVPVDPSNQLDVMISVYAKLRGGNGIDRGTQRVGFARIKVAHIQDWTGDACAPMWISCRPMAHLPSHVEPGAVLLSLQKSSQPVKDRGMPNVKPLNFELRAYLCMARGLVSQTGGSISPMCVVSCGGKSGNTETKEKTSAPVWNQCVQLSIQLTCNLDAMMVYPEPIQVVVYDIVQRDNADTITKMQYVMEEAVDRQDIEKAALLTGEINLQQLGAEAWQHMQDRIGDIQGDVLAKKRLGVVQDGRRVLGRVRIDFRHILAPTGEIEEQLQPKWVKLRGGLSGSSHAGDILIGFELMRKKHAKHAKLAKPKQMEPLGRKGTLSIAVLGLRNIALEGGKDLGIPKLHLEVPSLSSQGCCSEKIITWSKKPPENLVLSRDDVNKKWTKKGVSGYEFIHIENLDVILPAASCKVWEPYMRLQLLDEKDRYVAEGRLSLLPARLRKYVEATDNFPVEGLAGSANGGVPVYDVDEDSEMYVDIEHGPETSTVGVLFRAEDETSFPPQIYRIDENSLSRKQGISRGDWLVAYKTPRDETEKPTGHWTPSRAAAFLAQMDKKKVRPLMLRFRRSDPCERCVRLLDDVQPGLALVDNPKIKPPQIQEDTSKEKIWKNAGILQGWRIIDINGFSTLQMSLTDETFKTLLMKRPVVVCCRPFGTPKKEFATKAANAEAPSTSPVLLSGVPARVQSAFEDKLTHRYGCIAGTQVPRPSALLPPCIEPRFLNLRVARGGCLDVQGVTKHVIVGQDFDDDEAGTRSRPSVRGRLEDFFTDGPAFTSVELWDGTKFVGHVKLRYHIQFPPDPKWMTRLKDQDSLDAVLFAPERLRRRCKLEMPAVLRVRTYVVRGLNVSGALGGHGNPYLFFTYGTDTVRLDGQKKLNSVEPRFYKTEERDIRLPEQCCFEVGLFDGQENGDDLLIGSSKIDLEDRWYTREFQDFMKANKVPMEYRPLESKEEGLLCKGSLEMWVEILDASTAAEVPVCPLFEPPAVEVEIRVVLWTISKLALHLFPQEDGDAKERADVVAKCQLECKSCLAPQHTRDQDSDVHYSCVGDAEFNWRFVFSRIAVTPGVNLQCDIELSLWEQFSLKKQKMCETTLDMKNYCKKVARTGDMIELEANIDLSNQDLERKIRERQNDEAGNQENGSEDEEDDKDDQPEEEPEQEAKEIPAIASMRVLVQVLSQTEASGSHMVVGLGRDEPNRQPVLMFPKSGRTWHDTLPTVLKAVESIVEAYNTGKRRCFCMMLILVVVGVLVLGFVIKDRYGCAIMYQKSCLTSCKACQLCSLLKAGDPKLCVSKIQGGSACVASSFAGICNVKHGKCSIVEPEDGTAQTQELDNCQKPRIGGLQPA